MTSRMRRSLACQTLFYSIGNCVLLNKNAPLWIALRRIGIMLRRNPPQAENPASGILSC